MHSEKSEFFEVIFDFLSSPFRTISLFIQDLSRVEDRLQDDSIVVRAMTLAMIPFRLLSGFLSLMVQNWPTSRSGTAAILGVPAFFTLVGLLGAWVFADKFRSDTQRVSVNKGYCKFNQENFTLSQNLLQQASLQTDKDSLQAEVDTFAKSALAYSQKLVEIDPQDVDLKYQLGLSQARTGKLLLANDTMKSIAPDDEQGHLEAHLWRANYFSRYTTAEGLKSSLGLIEKHLAMAIAADPENLAGKAQLAKTYMLYANLLEEESGERLNYLEKSDEIFREIIDDETESRTNSSIKISILNPSVLIRKQLAAVAPEKYSVDTEVFRVKARISSLLNVAKRYNSDSLPLWLLLINSASEIQQFDFAVDIANQGLKLAESPATKQGIIKAKSFTFRKAALSINKFDDFEMYKKRFFYLCDAVRSNPIEPSNYVLLTQFVGKENDKPTIQLARQLGLSEPGDAVPIKIEWLRRACVETRYSGFLNSMIGVHEFHIGENESAIKSWTIAQQFDPSTRELISKLFELNILSKQNKLENFETMMTESLRTYPEAVRIRMLRGTYAFRQKEFQKAIDDFRIILETNPDELILHQRIKTCYQFMGDRAAATAEQDIIDIKLNKLPLEQQQQNRQMLQKMEAQGTIQ